MRGFGRGRRRRRRRKNREYDVQERETDDLASLLSPAPDYDVYLPAIRVEDPELLTDVEDRRSFYPDPYRPAGPITQRSASTVIEVFSPEPGRAESGPVRARVPGDQRRYKQPYLRFQVPNEVAICARRERRREVLFASGRGGRAFRRPKRRNEWSNIKCR